MATGKIKTLFSDKEKTEALFPRTKVSAISDDNGNGLTAVINNAITNASEVYVGDSQPGSDTKYKLWVRSSGGDTTIYTKTNDSWVEVSSFSGVYVGSGTMPTGYNVQIDPTGESMENFFAPTGYGLGGVAKQKTSLSSLAELNNIYENGWYDLRFSTNQTISGISFSSAALFVISQTNQYGKQIMFFPGRTNTMVRYQNAGTWNEWEWENPPMALGVEYRTTERCNGKTVYAKLVDFGALPSTTSKLVAYYGSGSTGLVSLTAMLSDGNILSAGYGRDSGKSTTYGIFLDGTLYNVRIQTESDFSSLTAKVLVKYTKD